MQVFLFLTEGPKFLNHHKGTSGKKLFMTTRYGLFLFSFAKLFHDNVSNPCQGYLGIRKLYGRIRQPLG